MSTTNNAALPALGRLLMAVIFVMGGWGKLMASGATIAYIGSHGLPLPQVGYAAAVAVELGGGLLILAGLQTRLVAIVLALWCIVTGVVFHLSAGDPGNMIHFLKNLAMAGGFLQLAAFGAGAWSLDAVLGRRRGVALA